jgi:hypothetical protein
MDNRWRFLYYRSVFERRSDTDGLGERATGRARPSTKGVSVVKYAFTILMCDGEGTNSTEAPMFTLARKPAIEPIGTRTANRHRWMRRES